MYGHGAIDHPRSKTLCHSRILYAFLWLNLVRAVVKLRVFHPVIRIDRGEVVSEQMCSTALWWVVMKRLAHCDHALAGLPEW